MNVQQQPLAVAVVGAGPWAEKVYAPMFAAGPQTRLAGVWSRTSAAAQTLAAAHAAPAFADYDAMLGECEAVAFAVPPDVQVEFAIRAARAGKHLILDKPLAYTLAEAERLRDAVVAAGVVTQFTLTHRFRPKTAAFLTDAADFSAVGARLAFLSGAFLRGPYANAWRREHGVLHDLGPHAFDLLEAALGPAVAMRGCGDPRRWVTLAIEHASGAISDVTLSGVMQLPQSVFRLDLYGPAGVLEFDAVAASADDPWSEARRSFVEAVRTGRSPAIDVHRGVLVQGWIERAAAALR